MKVNWLLEIPPEAATDYPSEGHNLLYEVFEIKYIFVS
jgi:hypothetical protein